MNWSEIQEGLRYEDVENALGLDIVSKGEEHICSCPLSTHGGVDRNPSFSLNVHKGVYNCFSCGGSGRIPELVRDILGYTVEEALSWLSQFSDVITDSDPEQFIKQLESWGERTKAKHERATEGILPYYSRTVLPPTQATTYFSDRSITASVSHKLELRYYSDWHRNGYYGECVVIPHFVDNELRGWQERWMDYENAPDYIRKYMASEDFPKKDTLYGWDLVNFCRPTIVVESALTVATLMSMGYQAVATFGASVSSKQIKQLGAISTLLIAYDNDPVGQKTSKDISKALELSSNVFVVPAPKAAKADLGDYCKEEVDSLIQAAEMVWPCD